MRMLGQKRKGERSSSFKGGICMEIMPMNRIFRPNNRNNTTCCSPRQFCTHCISNHVKAKLQLNIIKIRCPALHCNHSIHFDASIGILPKSILDWWERKLSKAKIMAMTNINCPFKKCSAPLVDVDAKRRTVAVAECPHCRKNFCTKCKVPWHFGMGCSEFQKTRVRNKPNEDDLLKQLVKKMLWKRCPNCKIYVEKTTGYQHIVCRCRYEFCYGCGSDYYKCRGKCGK